MKNLLAIYDSNVGLLDFGSTQNVCVKEFVALALLLQDKSAAAVMRLC